MRAISVLRYVVLGAVGGDSPSSLLAIGGIGGASLGAALGYLEDRKLAAEQRPRVR